MHGKSTGIGLCGGGAIERRFKVSDETVECRLVGARHSGGRHHAGTNLANDLLPGFCAFWDVRQIGVLQGKATRFGFIAMARNAVLIEYDAGIIDLLRCCGRLQDECSQGHTGNYDQGFGNQRKSSKSGSAKATN